MDRNELPRLSMAGLDKRIAELSPEKRALLLKRISRGNAGLITARGSGSEQKEASLAPEPIAKRSTEENLALSFTQQRLWFLDRLLPEKAAYNIAYAWRLEGRLDLGALQRALEAVVTRHEALRTRFRFQGAELAQLIEPAHQVTLPLTDLSTLQANEREERTRELLDTAADEPFDLEQGPLLRAQVLRVSAEAHALLLNVHHIAFDGWSLGVFNRELSTAYAAFVRGEEPVLPVLPIQYADYALWQRQWLQGEVLERQLGYWKAKLQALGTLELPTDRPRPPVQSYRGARYALELPAALAQALKALGRREGATLFMTMLAAFKVLLYRYSAQEDIAVGTPIAARGRTELEGLIGFFANTLVLRTALDGNPSFRELLARVRETALGAYTHQDLPFEKLVEELAPARDLSRDPLFQVMFVMQNAPGETLVLQGVEVSGVALENDTAKVDLLVSLREAPNGLRALWTYARDLFDDATIERMTGHFQVLLEGIVADPSTPIAQLPLLSGAERQRLLVQWNSTASPYPSACIHQLFEAQAARAPHAIAVRYEAQELTYAELNARANRLAHQLIAMGVGPEVLVGVCLERSLELVIALLAILKAGGAYVPLDPAYPNERLAFMLEDTKARVLVTAQALLQRLPRSSAQPLCIDRDQALYALQPDTNPEAPCHPEQLAYVIYTSGSTGKPKGVAAPHRGVVRLVCANDYTRFDAQQTFLLLSPISFDASTFELWGALLHGARCAIFPDEVPTVDTLGKALQRHQVSTLWLTASLFNWIIDEAPQILRDVRTLLAGGEALSPSHVCTALAHLPGIELINGYGPTENTTFTCCYRIPQASQGVLRSIPIGRPIRNTHIYVLDSHQQPVPIGAPGELYVGGAGLARGYLNREELTAERFLPDPFVAGERIYRTGDLARYLPDGNIEYLGRIDDQVKIRGFRIEPGEIETVLAEHPSVRQAVVIAREDSPGDKRLVAYVVAAEPVEIEALRALVRERLPEYMRPGAYVPLEQLPLTPNGKIDRKALPAPSLAPASTISRDTEPRDKVERILCTLWAETLGLERVGLDDNFFQIGGHSLLAAKLFSRLDRVLARTLPLATLFESPTIRELARFYRDGAEPAMRSALVPINGTGALPPLFAVPGVGGNVLGFAALVRELGTEQPFFGLQSIGLDGRREPLQTIERMAREYLEEVRHEQPHGPYYLLGACFGSAVAFEMAHQLVNAGETVAFLGLIDPSLLNAATDRSSAAPIPSWLNRGLAYARFITDRVRLYREGMRILGFRERMSFLVKKAQLLGEAVQMHDLFRGDRREFNRQRVADTNLRAMMHHKHGPLEGGAMSVEIFVSDQCPDSKTMAALVVWDELAGRSVVCHRVSGKDSGDALQGSNAKPFAQLLILRLHHAREGITALSPRITTSQRSSPARSIRGSALDLNT